MLKQPDKQPQTSQQTDEQSIRKKWLYVGNVDQESGFQACVLAAFSS